LLLADRGGSKDSPKGTIYAARWGSSAAKQQTPLEFMLLVNDVVAPMWNTEDNYRQCTDLHLRLHGQGAYRIWTSAAFDPGENPGDHGPFTSRVYSVGTVSLSNNALVRLPAKTKRHPESGTTCRSAKASGSHRPERRSVVH
jgi:hypothetical protein